MPLQKSSPPLVIALTKGRILDEVLPLLEQAGALWRQGLLQEDGTP